MTPNSNKTLEEAKRLLDQRESEQAEFEAMLQNSRQALARSQSLLTELKETLARNSAREPGTRRNPAAGYRPHSPKAHNRAARARL
jgi:hypothetical protein